MLKIGAIIVMLLYALAAIPAHASGAGYGGKVNSVLVTQIDAGSGESAEAPVRCCKAVTPFNEASPNCKAHCLATIVDGLDNRVLRSRVLPIHWSSPLLDRGGRCCLRPPIAT
ncbi:hypothetical protein [Oricola cellulosilytica]|uniref:Uncharacterized protein n=1 Tax=Oricola cellulosilytica TaxID=1429082 RepID=A0A4R0PD47_9HYPH|nr:hypothetical protein [Oricola cellulosilytica]TCD15412.1 hypothetical protein E0D97_07740 [Oricola cellulosilytica]